MCTSRDSKAHDAREENWHERGHSGVICEESGQRESETERNKKKMVRFVSNTVFCNQCRRSMRRVRARIRANAINFATEFKCSVPMTTKETLFHFALFRYFLLRSFFHSFCELACERDLVVALNEPLQRIWNTCCVATLYIYCWFTRRGTLSIHRYSATTSSTNAAKYSGEKMEMVIHRKQ